MKSFFTLFILSLWVFCCNNGHVWADSVYTNAARQQDKAAIDRCKELEASIGTLKTAICFRGDITEDSANSLIMHLKERPDLSLIINSNGGLTGEAMRIGRVMNSQQTRLIIAGVCHSSCANYLMPAASRLVVSDNSLALMHGSLPRSRLDYMSGQVRLAFQEGGIDPATLTVTDLLTHPAFNKAYDEFPEFAQNKLAEETVFFAKIGPDETYLHRYEEIRRNIRTYGKETCHPQAGLYVFVGPKMAEEFRFTNVEYFWWPSDHEVVEQASSGHNKINADRTLVLDMNLMPSYIPGRGFVEQGDCLKDIYKQTSE